MILVQISVQDKRGRYEFKFAIKNGQGMHKISNADSDPSDPYFMVARNLISISEK